MPERSRHRAARGHIAARHVDGHAPSPDREGADRLRCRDRQLRRPLVHGSVLALHRTCPAAHEGLTRNCRQPHPHEDLDAGRISINDAYPQLAGNVFPGLQRRRAGKPIQGGQQPRRADRRERAVAWHHSLVLAALRCANRPVRPSPLVACSRNHRGIGRGFACHHARSDEDHAAADGIRRQGKRQELLPHLRRAEDQARRRRETCIRPMGALLYQERRTPVQPAAFPEDKRRHQLGRIACGRRPTAWSWARSRRWPGL